MNKVRCDKGHYYDSDRFSTCPMCGTSAGNEGEKSELDNSKNNTNKTSKTTSLFDLIGKSQKNNTGIKKENNTKKNIETDNTNETEDKSSLGKAIKNTKSTDYSPLPKTVSYYNKVEPTVGWLVCIKGVYQGSTFECRVGNNRIGRNYDMEICLENDASITREAQAVVVYEPINRKFYIKSGNSSGIVYYNGNVLLEHEELKTWDKIKIGNADFIFYPLCGDDFTWDDYITNN